MRLSKYANIITLINTKRRRTQTMNKTTLSVQELASQLDIGLSKAYALVKEPDFPTVRIGTRILIPVDGLHEWLAHEAKGGGTVATEQ
jgi:excisionase family DNA binding protein